MQTTNWNQQNQASRTTEIFGKCFNSGMKMLFPNMKAHYKSERQLLKAKQSNTKYENICTNN